ncbi:MAG: polyprenyl synthetase family protein [Legionellaceae bacterium]|nr:polyprenyl synthetase family protein [Legionellaceae bacterium]
MNDHLPSLLMQHEQFLQQLLQESVLPAPILNQAIAYSLLSGGKRFRPLLVYLCGEMVELPMPVRDILAAAVEMTHVYSLIHDDLPAMDNDEYRRGKPTCHRAFDEATAILAGNTLANWAVELLIERLPPFLGASRSLHIVKVLLRAAGGMGMLSGQSLDMSVLLQANCERAELEEVHRLKTGALLKSCVAMVLIAADQWESPTGVALRSFADILGLLFQMQDDYLDRYASPHSMGKIRASDTANVKYTFADYLSKEACQREIDACFTEAIACLQRCGPKAAPLIHVTEQLQMRSNIL